jgi:hypothetical protein
MPFKSSFFPQKWHTLPFELIIASQTRRIVDRNSFKYEKKKAIQTWKSCESLEAISRS